MGSGLQRSRLLFRCQPCWHGSGWNCLPPWRFWVPCSALFFGQLYWPRLRRWRLVRPCRDWGRVGQLCWLLSCWDSGIIRGGVRSPSLSSLPRLRSPFRPVPPCSTEGCPMDGQLRWSSSVAPRDGQRRWPIVRTFFMHTITIADIGYSMLARSVGCQAGPSGLAEGTAAHHGPCQQRGWPWLGRGSLRPPISLGPSCRVPFGVPV